MAIPQGKGLIIWKAQALGPDVETQLARILSFKPDWVSIKVYDGVAMSNAPYLNGLINGLVAAGVVVRVWQFPYGWSTAQAKTEGMLLGTFLGDYPQVQGADLDVENIAGATWARSDAPALAKIYLDNLDANRPQATTLSLMSYRYPSVHMGDIPWSVFLPRVDFHTPQVYWEGSHNPVDQLEKSLGELEALRKIPVVPIGSTYKTPTWTPTAAEIGDFMDEAENLGLPGFGLYRLGTLPDIPGAEDAVRAWSWGPVVPPPPPPDPIPPAEYVPFKMECRDQNQNVRSEPSTKGGSGTVVDHLVFGSHYEVFDVVVEPGTVNVWARLSPLDQAEKWAAIVHAGTVYLE